MKVEIPNELKAGVPQTTWGRVLMATPVVMTVLATLLAGLASSEMTRAQYDRSLAAQLQSKAGDQWNFFQAKRLRGAMQRNAIDLLQISAGVRPLNGPELEAALKGTAEGQSQGLLQSTQAVASMDFLLKRQMPTPPAMSLAHGQAIQQALKGVESGQAEAEIARTLTEVPDAELAVALRAARERADAYDDLTTPVTEWIDRAERAIGDAVAAGAKDERLAGLLKGFTLSRLYCAAARYENEARLNQAVASLYELQVRKGNMSAERHHARSQRFFYGMLAAQAAVIIATFAMAARQRNLLWTLAATAGIAALILGLYVYLYV